MLKWSAFLFGIIVGSYFPDFFRKYVVIALVLAILLAIRPSMTYFSDRE